MNNENNVKECLVKAFLSLNQAYLAVNSKDNKSADISEKDEHLMYNDLVNNHSANDLFLMCLNSMNAMSRYADICITEEANIQRDDLYKFLKKEQDSIQRMDTSQNKNTHRTVVIPYYHCS